MKRSITCIAFAASTIAHAQVINQRPIEIGGDTDFIERTVKIQDAKGKDVVIDQILRKNSDGGFTYIYDLQPEATRHFERQFCADMGATAKLTGESVIGSETLAGMICEGSNDGAPKAGVMSNGVWLQPFMPSQDEGSENSSDLHLSDQGQLIVMQAYAPKNFAVPARQNYLYRGYTQVITNVAGQLQSLLQIGNGCRIGKQDWLPANINTTVGAAIACYANNVPSITTSMSSCLLGRCTTDTGIITVF